ncbi:MAG: hypothetical protein LIO54_08850 [Oscillospiraceae bacterium]|nr:hypothetical protein [Oscillospiraceae bacterium]
MDAVSSRLQKKRKRAKQKRQGMVPAADWGRSLLMQQRIIRQERSAQKIFRSPSLPVCALQFLQHKGGEIK